ncbi:Zn(2)-C6 fungal-type transcription factor [Pseudohyphozyma bogoriensis]|nr:Zn(2)-C6 fungal-type transcription factor [Pseudohyphozyma bogoriensis]
MALSCVECKRRKLIPDVTDDNPAKPASVAARNASATGKKPASKSRPTEHELLKARVAHLEALILRSSVAGTSASTAAAAGSGTSVNGGGSEFHAATPALTIGTGASAEEEEDLPDSDTEDAALVLEELALGRTLTRVGARVARRSAGHISTPPSHPPLPTPPFPGSSKALSVPPASRAMSSLLVPRVEGRRKLVFDDIWRTIPSNKPVLDWLINHYFQRTDWGWHVHHKPTFMAEYEAFSQLIVEGRKDEIDPLWLAIFCMTLCLSLNSVESQVESPLVNITEHDLRTLPWAFFEAAQSSLEVGDWTGKPRIRTLHTIALFGPFLLFAGLPAAGERYQNYLGAALRMAQQLNLHKLGKDPTIMPLEDVALPPGVNSLRREIPLRLLSTFSYMDHMAIRVKVALPMHSVDSASPGNFNDSDLMVEGIATPRPDDVTTDWSFERVKHQVSLLQRKFNEGVTAEAGFEYDLIMDLDKGYRGILESMPPGLREDYLPPLGEEITDMWRRSLCYQTVWNRMLRLHRPFMSRGYRDPKYRHSTDTAVTAARKCLTAGRALQRAPLIKSGFQLLGIQGSVVVLFMEIWTEFPEDYANGLDNQLISEAVATFERYSVHRHPVVQKIAKQSLQTISLLYEALDKKRKDAEARIAAGGSWSSEGTEEESFGHLLKRIGAIVVSTATSSAAVSGLDSLGAASLIRSPTTAFSPNDAIAPPPPLDQFLLPTATATDWGTTATGLFAPGPALSFLDVKSDIPTTFAPDSQLSTDFDWNALMPEYGSSLAGNGLSFDWMASSLGAF